VNSTFSSVSDVRLVLRDIGYWWQELATDDLTFWNVRRRPADVARETMVTNQLNPHPFCQHYGVEAVPIMLGGGHYYFRNTPRGQAILQRIADIMVEAVENPEALYWKFAGKGNIVGDEPAASTTPPTPPGWRSAGRGPPLTQPQRPDADLHEPGRQRRGPFAARHRPAPPGRRCLGHGHRPLGTLGEGGGVGEHRSRPGLRGGVRVELGRRVLTYSRHRGFDEEKSIASAGQNFALFTES